MIVSGGFLKGRHIPPLKSKVVRPTSALVRQGLFNVLNSYSVTGNFLDLFAGSGLVSYEAISRGFIQSVAVEADKHLGQYISSCASTLGIQEPLTLYCMDVPQFLRTRSKTQFNCIFIDPPYQIVQKLIPEILTIISTQKLLLPTGFVVLEHKTQDILDIPPSFVIIKTKVYGDTTLTFLQADY